MPVKKEPGPTIPDSGPSTKDRILLATIECVKRYGVTGATVRRITEAAGVNVASINYHFGSKDALLGTALSRTLEEGFPRALADAATQVAKHRGNIEAGIRDFFRGYLVNAFSYPRITVAQLHNALLEQDYSGAAVTAAREFLEKFYRLVAPAMLQRTESARRMAVLQVWATIFNLAMLPQLFGIPRESLTGEEMIGRLCATLFESL